MEDVVIKVSAVAIMLSIVQYADSLIVSPLTYVQHADNLISESTFGRNHQ